MLVYTLGSSSDWRVFLYVVVFNSVFVFANIFISVFMFDDVFIAVFVFDDVPISIFVYDDVFTQEQLKTNKKKNLKYNLKLVLGSGTVYQSGERRVAQQKSRITKEPSVKPRV